MAEYIRFLVCNLEFVSSFLHLIVKKSLFKFFFAFIHFIYMCMSSPFVLIMLKWVLFFSFFGGTLILFEAIQALPSIFYANTHKTWCTL